MPDLFTAKRRWPHARDEARTSPFASSSDGPSLQAPLRMPILSKPPTSGWRSSIVAVQGTDVIDLLTEVYDQYKVYVIDNNQLP